MKTIECFTMKLDDELHYIHLNINNMWTFILTEGYETEKEAMEVADMVRGVFEDLLKGKENN